MGFCMLDKRQHVFCQICALWSQRARSRLHCPQIERLLAYTGSFLSKCPTGNTDFADFSPPPAAPSASFHTILKDPLTLGNTVECIAGGWEELAKVTPSIHPLPQMLSGESPEHNSVQRLLLPLL
ncbi:Hypothetical predicted protein [Podarcis lilfordi]|uniref:Uncharacterized protein n=1 Tax=Podarcis lilfordi TaxID=74358 RepID=A0AA35JP06_9SAUR|nr:Hypothetical predicted protein [Podarcis lilfordi]